MKRPDALKLALWVTAAALFAHLGLTAGTIWSYDAINYDDPQVLQILDQKSVGEIITTPTWYAYKPIYFLSLKIDSLFGDATVQVGHGINWMLHGLATFLLVLLLFDIFKSPWIAGVAGVFFAVHPVHVENVAWFAERKDVLSMVFALWAHHAFRKDRARGRAVAWLPGLLLLLGGLTKGTVWSYAGVIFVDEWLHLRRARAEGDEGASWGTSLLRMAPLIVVALGGVVLDFVVSAQSGAAGVDHGVPTSQLIASMAGVHATYLQHVLVPVGLSLDYAVDPAGSWSSPMTILGLLLGVAAIFALAQGIRRRDPLLAFAAALWIFGLAPVNNIMPRTAALMADRYLYIPAIGIYLLLAALLLRTKNARIWILGAAVVALMVLCELRTAAFSSSERIWTDAIEKTPHSALAYIQRGTDRSTRGLHESARQDADAALALNPRPEFVVRAHLLRCQSLVGLGTQATGERREQLVNALLDEANAAARVADSLADNQMVRDDPSHVRSMAQNYVGNALEMQGDIPGSRYAYRRAVELDEKNANAWMNYGTMLLKSRDPADHESAVNALRQARDLAQGRLDIVLQLALAHGTRGDAKRALGMLERAEDRHGESAELLYTRASVLLRVAQDWGNARTILRRLRDVAPDHPKGTRLEADIETAIGRARLRKGRDERDVTLLKQAVDHFDEALKVLPSHWQAHVFAGDAFAEQGRYGEARRRYIDARRIAPRERWLASLIARTAALEAAVGARTAKEPGEIRRVASIMAAALDPEVRRIDLGFAPLQDELALLRELGPILERDREPERSLAAELLLVTALVVTGDELSALDRLRGVFGRIGGSVRDPELLDAALVLRSVLHERQTDFALAARDYELLGGRRPSDVLPKLRKLQIELRMAEARRQVAAGHADDPERMRKARKEVERIADKIRAFADAHPNSLSAGMLAVQAEINLEQWIGALGRLNALAKPFAKYPSVYRGYNAVYVAWYTQTRDEALIQQADENLRKARNLAPRDLRTAMDASQLARIGGDLKSALKNAQLARELESHPHGPASRMLADLHIELGKQALEGGQLEGVKNAILAARKVDPSRAGSWLLEGELALKSPGSDRVNRAHELARKAKALEPYNPAVDVLLAKCHKSSATTAMFHMGRYADPRPGTAQAKRFEAMTEEQRTKALAQFAKARTAYRQQAIHDLEMALMLDPMAEDVADTRKRLKTLRDSSPDDLFARNQKAQALVEKGDEARRNADLVGALYAYWDASKLAPQMRKTHLRAAQVGVQLLMTLETAAARAKTEDERDEARETAAKYDRMVQDALFAAEALDPERRVVQVFFLKGLVHQIRWRMTPKEFKDAREVARLAAIAAFEHFVLRRRAAEAPETDTMLSQAEQRLEALRARGG